jgi:RNA polymerase sigma factor (sigma-70 family)
MLSQPRITCFRRGFRAVPARAERTRDPSGCIPARGFDYDPPQASSPHVSGFDGILMPDSAEQFDQTSLTLFASARADSLAGAAGFSADLLAHYLPRLRAFVRARVGARLRRQESDSDIVQSVCRELIEERGRVDFETETAFRAWLFTAAMNKIRGKARYWDREKRAVDNLESLGADRDLDDLTQGYSGMFTPSRVIQAQEQLERLEAALEMLPEDEREAIALARIARLPHAEIAKRMDRSVGAVRQLLGRALRRLGEHLKNDDDSSTS